MFVEKTERPQGENDRISRESNEGFIKLSQAIRIGAKRREQCKHDGVGSCAWGAAWEAVHGTPYTGKWFPFYSWGGKHFNVPDDIVDDVWTKNDGGMTREAIADWLEAQGY